jgi:hypothetical protein
MMQIVRYGVPGAMLAAAFAILIVRRDATGLEVWAMLTGAALAVLLLNVLFRIGAEGDRERVAEDAARDYYSQHGHWPDERPRG